MDVDPFFVSGTTPFDVHLLPGSACIDTGDSAVPNLPAIDFEGDARILGTSVDIGADEFPAQFIYAASVAGPTLTGLVSLGNGEPLAPYFILQSNDPRNAALPGLGLIGGLHISLPDVAWQLTAGVAGNPLFGGTLDANGAFFMTLPGVGAFLSGQTWWGMGIQPLSTGGYEASDIASITF